MIVSSCFFIAMTLSIADWSLNKIYVTNCIEIHNAAHRTVYGVYFVMLMIL